MYTLQQDQSFTNHTTRCVGSSLPDSTTTHGTEQEEQQGGEVEENQSIEEPEVPLLEPVVEAVEQTQPEVETIAGGADEVNSAESTPKVPEVHSLTLCFKHIRTVPMLYENQAK